MISSATALALAVLSTALTTAADPAVEGPARDEDGAAPPAAKVTPVTGEVVERIVAVVNDSVVLLSEVDVIYDEMVRAQPPPSGIDVKRWRQERRAEILDSLVAEKLIEEEVRKLRVEVTDQEVERVVQATIKEHNLNDEATLKQALARQGLSLEEYKDGLKKQLTKMKIIQLKVKSRVTIDDQTVKAVQKQQQVLNADEYTVKARHILFLVTPGQDDAPAKQKAQAAMKRIALGEGFDAVAGELSEDTASAKRGGSLGEFGRGEMVPEFEKVAFDAKPGKVVGPVRTPFGWHVILVDERVPAATKGAATGLDDIRQRLYESEVEQAFRRYIDDLKRQAFIETRL